MGVVNITPDSFSDGGEFYSCESACKQASDLVREGADIIDIGGQSTRPGAREVTLEEELKRVIPAIASLRRECDIPISIDTTRVAIARAAVEAGADMINDISGGTFDREMLPAVARLGVPISIMHIRGTPQTMQQMTDYEDLLGEIYDFLTARIAACLAAGIKQEKIIVDPGIGFAKTYSQNFEILANLAHFRALKCPILIGTSRKSFIGYVLDKANPKERVWGTAATCCGAIAGGADILRVHDVREMRDVCLVADAIWRRS